MHTEFLVSALSAGSFQSKSRGNIVFRTHSPGNLAVVGDQIVADDPYYLMDIDPPPLLQKIPSGSYPVHVHIARFEKYDDERNAFAQVVFSEQPIARWELAKIEYQPDDNPPNNQLYQYWVDSGTGCFMDFLGIEHIKQDFQEPDHFYEYLDDQMRNYYLGGGQVPLNFRSGLNIIAFSSGFGDGVYPSYWGVNDFGQIASLITDFKLYETMDWFYLKYDKNAT